MSAEDRLNALGFSLSPLPTPTGNYVPFKRIGDLVFVSGRGARHADGTICTGQVGTEVSVTEAYAHARLCGVGLLAVFKLAAGSLDNVEVLKVLGMVNAAPDFKDHPKVINGCSDLFVEVLGEKGRHARSAVGMSSLPHNYSVEIEAVIAIR